MYYFQQYFTFSTISQSILNQLICSWVSFQGYLEVYRRPVHLDWYFCGLYISKKKRPVFCGLGPVWLRFFSSFETGLPNTKLKFSCCLNGLRTLRNQADDGLY